MCKRRTEERRTEEGRTGGRAGRVGRDGSQKTRTPHRDVGKYNSTKHSSTKLLPNQAHDDKNHMDVRVSLTTRERTRGNM